MKLGGPKYNQEFVYFQSFEITRVFKFHYTKTREVGFYSSGKEQGGGAYRWLRYVPLVCRYSIVTGCDPQGLL